MQFSVSVSGFSPDTPTDIQIWATTSGGDCSADAARGYGGVGAQCWPLPGGRQSVDQVSARTIQFMVRVQDIIGPQNAPPNPPVYTRRGPEACTSQTSSSSEKFFVDFIPVQNGNTFASGGSMYSYPLPVDLVGPPAPAGVHDGAGDTLLTLSWVPNDDTDTIGYDVFMTPIRGQEHSAPDALPLPEPVLACPDAGRSSAEDASATDAAATGAIADATSAAPVSLDAACHYVTVGGGGSGVAACGNPILESAVIQPGVEGTSIADDAGEGGATITPGSAGISTVPQEYLVGASSGLTVSDESAGSYPMTGLKNGVTYTMVVAAVDSFGNIGPPSTEQCDSPAPVDDFWNEYKHDQGGAGGFCALGAVGGSTPSMAGVALAVAVAAVARRRRGVALARDRGPGG